MKEESGEAGRNAGEVHSRAGTKGTEVWKKEHRIRNEAVGREAQRLVSRKRKKEPLSEARREEKPGSRTGSKDREEKAEVERKTEANRKRSGRKKSRPEKEKC